MLPSVLATASETSSERASVSVALALAPVATSVALAVLTSGSTARLDANATGTVKTSEFAPPAAIAAPVEANDVSPVVPATLPHVAAPSAAQPAGAVNVTPAGSASPTVTSAASVGPAFVTVMTYVAVPPGVYVALPSVFAMPSTTCAARVSLSLAVRVGDAGSLAVTVLISGSAVIVAA